jgi:hypothetical protein
MVIDSVAQILHQIAVIADKRMLDNPSPRRTSTAHSGKTPATFMANLANQTGVAPPGPSNVL